MSKFLKVVEEAYSQLDEAANDPFRGVSSIVNNIAAVENLYGKEGEQPKSLTGKVIGMFDPKARKVKELKKKLDTLRQKAGPELIKNIELQINNLTKQLQQANNPTPPSSPVI